MPIIFFLRKFVLIVVDKPRKPGKTGRHYLVETEDEKSTTTTTASTTELTDAVAAKLDALQKAEDEARPAPDKQYDI